MAYEISSMTLPAQPAAVIRDKLMAGEMSVWLPQAYGELFDYLSRIDEAPAGPPYARFRFLSEDEVEVEAGVPVDTAVEAEGRVEAGELPAGPVATTLHTGRYEALDLAYVALHTWLAERGFEPLGSHWECYLTDPQAQPDPEHWQTIVVQPYRAR